MMRKALILLSAMVAGICGLAPISASAQSASAVVVNICGTPPATYTPGANRALTQDTGGKQCVNATVSATIAVAPLTSSNLSSTVAVTNTFQSIQVLTAGRNGCTIENQSTTNAMWVFFGAIGSATKGSSFILDTSHGLAISCAVGGLGVLTDQVSITGTAADAYVANFQ